MRRVSWRHASATFGSAAILTVTAAACQSTPLSEANATTAVATSPTASPDTLQYRPLWPFASHEEADQWLLDGPADDWHADAEATAHRFTRDYLGFSGIDHADAVRTNDREAWVEVGFAVPGGAIATAATVHLARFGSDAAAPWEVVGTQDTVLTLDSPGYGSTADSPIEAGGVISGVDECIHLAVRQISQPDPLGEFSCRPAGGDHSRWAATVTFSGAQPGTLTLVAWTGGHVVDVERFAVTALGVPTD
ncbi:hypothetical protein ABQE69_14900 [Mycolicibacillus trivialis]